MTASKIRRSWFASVLLSIPVASALSWLTAFPAHTIYLALLLMATATAIAALHKRSQANQEQQFTSIFLGLSVALLLSALAPGGN
ncbi:hypothetical protein [Pseudomonas sp.]|uniref:hypothetical protein n=1 Tax=Pseudomonas sp. TaxID=306 RepID=UPI003C714D1E